MTPLRQLLDVAAALAAHARMPAGRVHQIQDEGERPEKPRPVLTHEQLEAARTRERERGARRRAEMRERQQVHALRQRIRMESSR